MTEYEQIRGVGAQKFLGPRGVKYLNTGLNLRCVCTVRWAGNYCSQLSIMFADFMFCATYHHYYFTSSGLKGDEPVEQSGVKNKFCNSIKYVLLTHKACTQAENNWTIRNWHYICVNTGCIANKMCIKIYHYSHSI